jgi:hypothetical protein
LRPTRAETASEVGNSLPLKPCPLNQKGSGRYHVLPALTVETWYPVIYKSRPPPNPKRDMERVLNITNGDSAVEIMERANIPGNFLPWRDVLHDGPVPAGLSLEELSEVRAQFIAECGWGEPESIRKSYIARDAQLRSSNENERIILWFEHDLYDQLQIIQILDWFYHSPAHDDVELSIICKDIYLGRLSTREMLGLFKYEEPVTEKHLGLASNSWAAFRASSPEYLSDLIDSDTSALPFLKGAITRLLEEYPTTFNGLSRTEQQALAIIEAGEKRPGRVFGENQKLEERVFMGDSSFWAILNGFLKSNPPLLTLPTGKELTLPVGPDQKLTITPAGREILSGKRTWLDIVEYDRWIGGVHLTPMNTWCWDPATRSIVKKY